MLLAIALVGSSTLVGASMAPAGAATINVSEAPEFSAIAYGDRWDFNNVDDVTDMSVVNNYYAPGMPNADPSKLYTFPKPAGNQLSFPLRDGTQLFLVRTWDPLAVPSGRLGTMIPVDANAYTKVSFKATYDGTSSGAGVYFDKANCTDTPAGGPDSCAGGVFFSLLNGTHVYTINMAVPPSDASRPAAWSGLLNRLFLTLNSNNVLRNISIDWVRVHGTTGNPITDPYEPGQTVNLGGNDYVIDARPRPRLLDPDLAGGQDYATTVRGDAWDMDQITDLSSWGYASVGQSGGRITGSGFSPPEVANHNDPHVYLAMPSNRLNPRRWHRLTVKASYGGYFGLADVAKQGMDGRFIWVNDSLFPGAFQESQDLVVVPGDNTFSFDLITDPVEKINEESIPYRKGWGGPESRWINGLRWDPHEDPDTSVPGRTWTLDDVRLARNDIADPTFSIRWIDGSHETNSTANLYLVGAPGAAGGTKLNGAPIPTAANENTFVLNAPNLDEQGLFYVRLEITDPSGDKTTTWSSGPVETSTPVEFTDIIPGDTFFTDVQWLVKSKIANGQSPDVYGASAPVQRMAMAAFLYRAKGSPPFVPPAESPFSDVFTDHAFYKEITWLAQSGITTGYPDRTFRPTSAVQRMSMAAFLYRFNGVLDGVDPPCVPAVAPFVDVASDHPFCGEIQWLVGTAITTGYADDTYRPGVAVSRMAMAAFLRRYHVNVAPIG